MKIGKSEFTVGKGSQRNLDPTREAVGERRRGAIGELPCHLEADCLKRTASASGIRRRRKIVAVEAVGEQGERGQQDL